MKVAAGDVTFVMCVEANRLAPQAILLSESIRTFGGRHCEAAIVAVSPRPQVAVDRETCAHLRDLGVSVVVEPLNETGSAYGPINRIVTAAWAEANLASDYLVILDTDTLMVGEPVFVAADVGVRPVDTKGTTSSGPEDPRDIYWRRLSAVGGIDVSRLPFVTATVDRARVRASYNGGFTVARRATGVLGRTRDVFFAAYSIDLRPTPDAAFEVVASTGPVGRDASTWWGSSQAAQSVAMWSVTTDVHVYDDRYDVPLHLLQASGGAWPTDARHPPILVHYHYGAEAPHRHGMLATLARIGCGSHLCNWVASRLRVFDR